MKLKTAVQPRKKTIQAVETLRKNDLARKLLFQVACFVAGLLLSHASVFGAYSPFGVAAVAALPYGGMPLGALGTAIGYLSLGSTSAMRYIAALVAVCGIRWTLNDLKNIKTHPLFTPLIGGIPVLATGLAVLSMTGLTVRIAAIGLGESLLAAGGAYFMGEGVRIQREKKSLTALTQQELASVVLTLCLFLLALDIFRVGSFSLGRALAVLGILFAARFGGVTGGSVFGVAAGAMFCLSPEGSIYVAGAYALGGLVAGVFSSMGKLATATVFVLSSALISLQAGSGAAAIAGLYEVMAAAVVFMILPPDLGSRIARVFSPPTDLPRTNGLRRSVVNRLQFASKALRDVSCAMDAVSEKLRKICAPDFNGVFSRTFDDACKKCGLRVFCWEKKLNETRNAFNDLVYPLRSKGQLAREDFPEHFIERCVHPHELVHTVNRHYAEFTARESADRRVNEVRTVVSEQFFGMSDMLADMAAEYEEFESFDSVSGEAVEAKLRGMGVTPVNVLCRIDRFRRMTVEIRACRSDEALLRKNGLVRELSHACGRQFDAPCITTALDECSVRMTERPGLDVAASVCQHICDDGVLCGDSAEYFLDGQGRAVTVISDGMGTGGRAAVDGAMAAGTLSRLIQAGMGFDCALRIVNSALLVKSTDESLSTLDTVCIDLFTGTAKFYKAGAPLSFVRRKGRVSRLEMPSLPAGIIKEIQFAKEEVNLGAGDIVVMVSDGAVSGEDDWICEMIEKWQGRSAQGLAEKIIAKACEFRSGGRDDDITVAAMIVREGRTAQSEVLPKAG